MQGFQFYMPTNVIFGRGCVLEKKALFSSLGKKAMIVTGRSSAKKNGSQDDVVAALESLGIAWIVFDEIEENPSVETVVRASEIAIANNVDFFVAIGGGSPMDAAKGISVLTRNPSATQEDLYLPNPLPAFPLVAIPTTAGTGSEVTPFAVLTVHAKKTKLTMVQRLFPQISFLDPKYMDSMQPHITNNTAIDALSHLIESYLTVNANFLSDRFVEMGLALFCEVIPSLRSKTYTEEDRDKLMLASTLAGMAIAQTGTSLPHLLGYCLTYEKGVAHGAANAVVTPAYLELFPEGYAKLAELLRHLGMESVQELGEFFQETLELTDTYTQEDVENYTEKAMESEAKLLTFPYPLTRDDVYLVYQKSLLS